MHPLALDEFLLRQLGLAEEDGRDLLDAGTAVMKKHGWTLDQYGQSVKRLVDAQTVVAQLVKAGGKYVIVWPEAVTEFGWHRLKVVEDQEQVA